ncbi:DNA gyrase subunit A [Candidatus Saccharibacteria bacterium]|nr:DNA gyrase subunit A [Candidatus Saccharibacteria bacterium]
MNDDHSKSVIVRSVEDEMETKYLQYSMSVIIARALPDVRDGLKPVHRRILYSMEKNNWRPGSKFVKSARITGDVMGKYHPHGDSAIYDSMARLAQDWSMRYTLVDGQGNFGSMDGDPPAAARYTEARMDKMGADLLSDLEKDTVDFRDNYDGSEREPSVLPAKVPNLLLNGQMGIAVGMATNIPPHNLGELVDATVHMIDHEETTTDDLLEYVKGPDFPTGGIVYGKESIRTAYASGRGGVVVRAVASIEETNKGRHQIIVTEVPYAVNKATLIEKIADLVKDKKITGISDLRDESARGTVKIVVDLKRDAYPKKVLNQLYKHTPLQTAFHYNMLALVDGIQPKVLSLHDMLSEYLKHRRSVVRRRTVFELKKAQDRAHILEGLSIALDHIDEVIAVIRASQTTDEAQKNLMERFKLSEIQTRAILAMQLRSLAGLERKKIEDELAALRALIAKLEAILADEKEILKIVKSELLEMKAKHGDDRRTQIIPQELGKFSDEQLIPEEQVVVTVTSENYIKRSLASEYRRQNRGGKGKRGMATKEADFIEHVILASTHDYLLFFTNKGRVFRLKTYEVPATGLNAKGVAAVNLLQLHPEEVVTAVIKHKKSSTSKYFFMTTKKGTVKKTKIEDYDNIRTSGLIAIKIDDGDELKWIRPTSGADEVVISTSFGQAIRFSETDARAMGRTARGVRGIRLRPEDVVVGMDVVKHDSNIFVISEKGYGKRTKISQFSPHKRGGVGIRSAVVNKKTGNLVSVKSLTDETPEIIIISNGGQTIRLGLKDIPALGRTTQGVRIMRLADNDSVASVALVSKEQVEDIPDGDDSATVAK